MGSIETRTFRSGNSVAVRLPRELGISADVLVTIEKTARGGVKIEPVVDPEEAKRAVARLIAALEAIGPVGEVERRKPPSAPRRRGL